MDLNDVAGSLCENGSRSQGSLSICSESKLQKSSILKPSKARPPLQDLNFFRDANEDDEDFETVRKRKVSFHHVNNIKEFCPSSETLKICNTAAYDETLSSESSNFSRSLSKTSLVAMSMDTSYVHPSNTDSLMDISDSSMAMEETRGAPISDILNARPFTTEELNDLALRAMEDSPSSERINQLLEESNQPGFMERFNFNSESIMNSDMSMTCFNFRKDQRNSNVTQSTTPVIQPGSKCTSVDKELDVSATSLMELTGIVENSEGSPQQADVKTRINDVGKRSIEMQSESETSPIPDSIVDMSMNSILRFCGEKKVDLSKESDCDDFTTAGMTSVLDESRLASLLETSVSSKIPTDVVQGKPATLEKSISPDMSLCSSVMDMSRVVTERKSPVGQKDPSQENDSESDGASWEPAFFRDSVSAERIEKPVQREAPKSLPAAPASPQNWFASLKCQQPRFSQCDADMSITEVLPLKEITRNSTVNFSSSKTGFMSITGQKSVLEITSNASVEDSSKNSPLPTVASRGIKNSSLSERTPVKNDVFIPVGPGHVLSVSQVPVLEFDSSVVVTDENKPPCQLPYDLSQISDISVDLSVSMICPGIEASVVKEIEAVPIEEESMALDKTCPKMELSSVLAHRLNATEGPSVLTLTLPPPELTRSIITKDSSVVGVKVADTSSVPVECIAPPSDAPEPNLEADCNSMEVDEPMDEEDSEIIPPNRHHTSVIVDRVESMSQLLPSTSFQPKSNINESSGNFSIVQSPPSEEKCVTQIVNETSTTVPQMNLTSSDEALAPLTTVPPKEYESKYSHFGFMPTRRLTLNFTMDNTVVSENLEESRTESVTQSFSGVQSIQSYEVRVGNRLFMEKLGLERVDLDEWRWPIRRERFNLIVKCPLEPLNDTTRPSSLSYEVIPGKLDSVTSFLAEQIKQTYPESWLAVRCNTLKDLTLALKPLKVKLTQMKPLCCALHYVTLRYPCTVSGNALKFTIVDMKAVVKFDVTVDLKNWENISGADVAIGSKIGNVNENIVRLLFNDVEKNDSIFYAFINKLRKYRERLLI